MDSLVVKEQKQSSTFEERVPRFFKIILDHTIRDGKTGIPKKFARKYGDLLTSPVLVKVCNGEMWKIELNKCDGEIWLQKGWQEFVDHYSLAHGHLLVFEFHQKISCHFNVLIFDKNASEIDYPSSNTSLENRFQEPAGKEIENDSTPVAFDETLQCEKRKGKSSLPFSQPGKMMKVEHSKLHARKLEDGRLISKAKTRSLNAAMANFKSENPFFMVVMRPTYVSSRSRMAIPTRFAMKYLGQNHGDAILNVLDGGTWPVRYCCYLPSNGQSLARFAGGWLVFARENRLRIGDVCIFELINGIKTTFNVSIFRCDKQQSIDKESTTSNELIQIPSGLNPPGDTEAAKDFTSVYPSFKVVMASSYLESSLNVPSNFVRNMEQSSVDIKLQVENRSWPVKLNTYPEYQKKSLLSAGWRAFARDNSLKVGDVCIFELINRKTMLINVNILRHSD